VQLVVELSQGLRHSPVEYVRTFCAVLLRQMLARSSGVWDLLSPEHKLAGEHASRHTSTLL
jgi:hypothetical protein